MSTCTTSRERPKSVHRALIARHSRQILNRSDDEHDLLCNVFAITFRPGNRTACFSEPLRKLGQGVLICLSYGRDEKTGRRSMPVCGFRASMSPDGFVTFGGEGSLLFYHDAAFRPTIRSRGLALNPMKNASLSEIALRMDRTCRRALGRLRWLPSIPQLPQMWLGFPMHQPPEFEDSEALRELAAIELNVPVEDLGRNGEMLLQSYLRDLFSRQLMHPNIDPANTTGGFLSSAEFCTQAHKALRAYEDYSTLLGAPTWNPARRVRPFELPNPAAGILKEFGIESLEQPISPEQLAAMVSAFRHSVGPENSLTETEVYDAFANVDQQLRAWTPKLSELRSLLEPAVWETVTDDDLLRAASAPDAPLIASRGSRIQVLQRHTPNDSVALRFSPEDLGRRAELNLCDAS